MTIKRRVRIALFLMMFVPFLIMLGAVGFTRGMDMDAYGFGPFGRSALSASGVKSFMAEFNRIVNDSPKSLSDPRSLAALDAASAADPPLDWRILKDGRELYRSSGARTGATRQWRVPWAARMMNMTDAAPDFTWSFRFADGSAGTLALSSGTHWEFPSGAGGLIMAFFALLVMSNGFLSWWISASVVKPLARLRDAAIRVGDGDLGFTLAPAAPDEFGQVTAAFETMREKLRASLARQVAEEASRKEMIAHVSHDLRTPINLIRGYAEGLRDGVASTPGMRARYLDTILESAGRMEKLIETLFAFSRLDLEGIQPKMATVEILPFLRELRLSLLRSFPDLGIDVREPGGAGTLRIRADAELTRRAVTNLVENAVRHGGKPGMAVQWRVERRAPAMVDVAVSDDGAGVAAEDMARIFEPFFRGDRARTGDSAGAGAGLGLSIVARIMTAQGGSARAGKGPAGGLEVTLSFKEAGGDA